jgi:outer membrane protein TolC
VRAEWFAFPSFLALGCVGTGIRGDLASVHEQTGIRSADVSSDDVESSTPRETRELLRKTLDADTAVRIALLDNRELRATLREMGVSRGRLAQAAAVPNPAFEVEVLPERTSNFELRAEYDITGLVLAPIRANAAAADVDASRLRAAGLVIATGYRARAAFHALAAAEQKLAIENQWLDAEAASRDAAEAMSRAGNATVLDFATRDAAYQTARAEVAEAELAAEDAREALVRILDLHGQDVTVAIDKHLPPAPEALDAPADLEARAIRASFDLLERKSRLESLGRRAGVARAEGWIPDLAADVHAFQGERNPLTGASIEGGWALGAGVRASVPLFDRKQGTSAAVEAELRAELERYYGAAADTRSRARSAYARLVTAHGRAKQYQNVIVPARKRVVEQAMLEYNAMQLDVFQLLAAKQEQLRAELAAQDALASWWTARAALDAIFAGYTTHAGGD